MQKVLSSMRKAIEKYNLIQNGDKIAVGVSGGKDSMVLLKALSDFKKFNLYNYELYAVTIDIYSNEVDYSALKIIVNRLMCRWLLKKLISSILYSILEKKKIPALYVQKWEEEH